jgi:hypothetical protein
LTLGNSSDTVTVSGWPDWANFRRLGDCLIHWAVF